MRSPRSSRSPFRSSTSALLLVAAFAPGCGDDECGTGGAPNAGLLASSADVQLEYGDLTSLAGNDCPDPNVPIGEPTSITLEGFQVGGTGRITICIPRPDLLLPGSPRSLGLTNTMADLQLVDLTGDAMDCTYRLDQTRPPLGDGSGRGVCDDGEHPDGFSLNIDGSLSLRRTCGATVDTIAVQLRGEIAVTKRE